MSKLELLGKCKELGITKCKSKNKSQLTKLINAIILTDNHVNKKYSVLSLFTGIGGMDMGFGGNVIVHKKSIANNFMDNIKCNYEEIDGFVELEPKMFDVVFQNDILEGAKNICELNNIQNNYIIKSIYELLNENYNFPRTDVIICGFPCFIEGTKILTQYGYKNIECVNLYDKLLTHKGYFQPILNLQKKMYDGFLYEISVSIHPEIITCTKEHPFYVRENKKIWKIKLKKYKYILQNPIWKKANELTMNDYFGIPINDSEIIPEFTFEKISNKFEKEYIDIKLNNLDHWFVMVYFVRNGFIGINKIQFVINDNEIFEKINKVIEINNENFECTDFMWYKILIQFDDLIPEWIQNAPKAFIQEFINGYTNNNINNYISYNVAFGLQRLYLKLGHIFCISKMDVFEMENQKKCYIIQ
jgi:hypothetical protein